MPVRLCFLGWNAPILPAVCAWLHAEFPPRQGTWDLSQVMMVTPGDRAGRRLLELLVSQDFTSVPEGVSSQSGAPPVQSSSPNVVLPPRLIQPGQLAEVLLPPQKQLADPLTALMTRAHVLLDAPDGLLQPLGLRQPLSTFSEALSLARELEAVSAELATGLMTPGEVAAQLRASHPHEDAPRWEALAALELRYQAALTDVGLSDRLAAQLEAARTRSIPSDSSDLEQGPVAGGASVPTHLVLVSTPDLSPLQARLLERAAGAVTVLVGAPQSEAGRFSSVGTLRVDGWDTQPIPLQSSQLRVVERPREVGPALLESLRALKGAYAASQISVGVCDAALLPVLEQALEQADVPARPAVGEALASSAAALLLSALADLMDDPKPARVGALLRHPALEEWLRGQPDAVARGLLLPPGEWITLFDKLWTEHLPSSLPGWPGEEDVSNAQPSPYRVQEGHDAAAAPTPAHARDAVEASSGPQLGTQLRPLTRLFEALRALLSPESTLPRPLTVQAGAVRRLLHALYGHRSFHRFHAEDRPSLYALEAIGMELASWQRLPESTAEHWMLSFPDALRFLLERIGSQRLPAQEGPDCLELLGWLELPLDDAPVLVLAGFNEGRVPESRTAHPFLPDTFRTKLGLPDNQQRLARDAFMLWQLLHSRPHVKVISVRKSLAGDPLLPSRLMLQAPPEVMARRLLEYFREDLPGTALWMAAGNPDLKEKRLGFYRLLPRALETPIQRLSVTAFRTYLACPYRFYLQQVLRLSNLDDAAQELSGGLFGSLAHDALQSLGDAPYANATDAPRLRQRLVEVLDSRAKERFGAHPGASVMLQIRHLRRRLERFAEWQAKQASEGWRIYKVEQSLSTALQVDGMPFVIEGRVDRIDAHEDGRYRILDYKTQDKPRAPEKTHRAKVQGEPVWVDLQLPLYRMLASSAQLPPERCQVGYVALSADLEADPFLLAPWEESDYRLAQAQVEQVIRAVRQEVFWPPREMPQSSDPFSGITFDRCLDSASFGTRAYEELQG